jgi:acetyl esterase/lipase
MGAEKVIIPEGYIGGEVTIGGVRGLHITKENVRKNAAMLYIHGGGFTLGSGMTAGPLLAHIQAATNLEGYSVDYSLAPEAKFPVAINECVSFYKGLLDQGYTSIVIGGESAGAAMTLNLVFALKQEGLPMPAAIWCSSPLDDIRFDQRELFVKDMFVASNNKIMDSYVGDADITDPRLSAIYGDFSNFPPTFIQSGSRESLSACSLRLVDKLVRAGNEVRFTFGKGMPHTFAMDYAIYPEANNAMNEILQFINDILNLA